MNVYFLFIFSIIILDLLTKFIVNFLNLKKISSTLPEEFQNDYPQEKYQHSQSYLRVNTQFQLIEASIYACILLLAIGLGFFNALDVMVRKLEWGEKLSGVTYIFSLFAINAIIALPFSYYHTFVIEETFGFNKTSLKTFLSDLLKGTFLSFVIGAPLIWSLLWFFEHFESQAWLYCWAFIFSYQIVMMYIGPHFLMPLFNTFTPLEEGELKASILEYAQTYNYPIKEVYAMDGSKRSGKSNAFFTGFGKHKRIVLYDTLLEKHSNEELLSILAHEMGHYKRNHIFKMTLFSGLQMGLLFFLLSLFLNNQKLFDAFGMQHLSHYASLIFFAFLYSPIASFLSIIFNVFSRKYEFEADNYAISTTQNKDIFIKALKKLSVHNLSNLTPHPLKVFLEYSHPPVLQRIESIRNYLGR